MPKRLKSSLKKLLRVTFVNIPLSTLRKEKKTLLRGSNSFLPIGQYHCAVVLGYLCSVIATISVVMGPLLEDRKLLFEISSYKREQRKNGRNDVRHE